MEAKNIYKGVKDFIVDAKNYPKHRRWNRDAVDSLNAREEFFNSSLPDYQQPLQFKNHVRAFISNLRTIQDIVLHSGFKQGIFYISDLFEVNSYGDNKIYYIGLMYPINGVRSNAFQYLNHRDIKGYSNSDDELHSVLECLSNAFSTIIVDSQQKYNLSDSLDYRMVTFMLEPGTELVTDNEGVFLDESIIDAINLDLNAAFERIEPGSLFTDEGPLEA